MEEKDEALIQTLLEREPELRRYYEEHVDLERRLGAARLAAGEAANVGTLEPVYVRPPDAELPRSR